MPVPFFTKKNNKQVLVVNDKPFIMLAGETHNSNASSLEVFGKVLDTAVRLNLNTVFTPVYWELIEPREGVFDFTLVDGLINQAKQRGIKLAVLWFGTWKNAQLFYAPSWVKTDMKRFKRAEVEIGQTQIKLKDFYGMSYASLSYLCDETVIADAKAFRAFLLHLKEIDETENTVIMVQVENETGLLGAAREHSNEADAVFASRVPQEFAEYMRSHTDTMVPEVKEAVISGSLSGDWKAVFGKVAEEIFSAYHFAKFTNKVAAAGKEAYPLPMYVNCWLDRGEVPGKYPTGGPVSRVLEVWKYCAPSIDVFAPDIYVPYFCDICDEYTRRNNPLLIPETPTHNFAGPRLVYVVGHHHALGFSPFGFEEMGKPFSMAEAALFGVDTSDESLIVPHNIDEYAWYNKTLNEMMPLLVEKYGTDDLQAVCSERQDENTMIFGDYGFRVIWKHSMIKRTDGVCLVLKAADDEFYIIANGIGLSPFSNDKKNPNIDILVKEEGQFTKGKWRGTKRLNGDEIQTNIFNEPTLIRIKLFAYH